jgi:hypothetical protein
MGLYSFENKDKFEIIHIINIQNDDTLIFFKTIIAI